MIKVDFDAVTAIIREVADAVILPRFRKLTDKDIAYKIGDDPVTIADKEAESALSERLVRLLPGSNVVGEEAFAANPGVLEAFSSESPVWIIDPIDGTRNFVKGNTRFGVIIALAKQNQTIAGWIYDPSSGEVVTAEKGGGAYFKGQKLSVLPAVPFTYMTGFLGAHLMSACQKSRLSKEMWPEFQVMGASAHSYPRLVIDGPHFGKDEPKMHIRASLNYSTPWDDSAGVLMHEEAGGYAAYWNGKSYEPSGMAKGLALTPDKQSWKELRAWCLNFINLP